MNEYDCVENLQNVFIKIHQVTLFVVKFSHNKNTSIINLILIYLFSSNIFLLVKLTCSLVAVLSAVLWKTTGNVTAVTFIHFILCQCWKLNSK